jgi:hypothetical protein
MITLLLHLLRLLPVLFGGHRQLALENLALRQQLAVYKRMVSIDFFTVPTARLRVLFVLVVLAHHRRRVVHFNVTEHPTAVWTAQQIVDALPDDSAPAYLLRDHDQVYGQHFRHRVKGMGIDEVLRRRTAPGRIPSPNALSARSGATVSTTLSSSASATCVTS